MHGETNENVADEIASRRVVQDMQDAQSTNNDELLASASAEEHDYIAVNDKFVSGTKKTEKSKKRMVYAPQAERNSTPPAVISVKLDEDEDVEWIWTHTADGKSVVTGYIITKRADKPRQRREVSDDSNRSSSRRNR
jgi:thiamine monophosphate synthase